MPRIIVSTNKDIYHTAVACAKSRPRTLSDGMKQLDPISNKYTPIPASAWSRQTRMSLGKQSTYLP